MKQTRQRQFFLCVSAIGIMIIVFFLMGFTFHWELDETPEGAESATIVEPIQVIIRNEMIEIPSHSASLALMQKYSVYLTLDWTPALAYRLLQTFESIPQRPAESSVWLLSDQHVHNDIDIEYRNGLRVVTIATEAFTYADPLLAEIEGVRGRYFSKRLHRAVVRFATDNGTDRHAIDMILEQRYAVSVNVPDYSELTKHTTAEHAGRFDQFKNEELIALTSMLEEYPTGMIKTPGLKYLIRRLDGTPHPTHPTADAVAWTGAGYIEFMESAFKEKGFDSIHRLILHEKAHFLWAYLFDESLKQDWIELGGWYQDPDAPDGWSTTKQVEFVSAYAHAKNPNEDMAESISYYIVNPDKLRSRSPAKYEFIQNRVMHGTRYISRIREDLTFQVYNLYPDYVYPGRIVRVNIEVVGAPKEDKQITVEIELHAESDLDTASRGFARVLSEKDTREDIYFHPIDAQGNRVASSHILRSVFKLSRYAANGYWRPYTIEIKDAVGNERFSGQQDFAWKLYIDNPLADVEPPVYVPNSMQLSLSEGNENGRAYQIVNAQWRLLEDNGVDGIYAQLNDATNETYSRRLTDWGEYRKEERNMWVAIAKLKVPDYFPSGTYKLVYIKMKDYAQNNSRVYFTEGRSDEPPAIIEIQTSNPDIMPPELDVNQISINAEPTQPEDPNGETRVEITFRVRDDISGHRITDLYLRDPQGVRHNFDYYDADFYKVYFTRDPTVYENYHKTIILPVGSPPGTWGLAGMSVSDKAKNILRVDFTEIVRFEIIDAPVYVKSDVNQDGIVNIQDLVLVASAIGSSAELNTEYNVDVNADGVVNVLDLVQVANDLGT